MSVLLNRRVLLAGLASWLAPLLVSMGFFDREGNLTVAAGLFHSVMSVVLAGVVAWAMVWVGRAVPLTAGAGLAIGLRALPSGSSGSRSMWCSTRSSCCR